MMKTKSINDISPAELRKIADLKEEIAKLQVEFNVILGVATEVASPKRKYVVRMKLPKVHRNGHLNGHAKKLHWTQTPAGRRKCRRNRMKFLARA